MPVEVRTTRCSVGLDARRVKRVAQTLLQALGKEESFLSILLTDDQTMAQLHRQWMGESTPTDVLSFPMNQRKFPPLRRGAGPPEILGDIALSVETAARRAPLNATREVTRYLVHGLLHLAGHDHQRPRDRRRMNGQARRLWRALSKRGDFDE